jgi:ATP-binding cassette subfamily F protein uup
MPKARGTKAKARVDAFHELKEEVSGRRDRSKMQIDIKGQRLGKKILEAHNISKSFGDKVLFENFDYKFKKKERVGVVGPNGVGKTTFLKVLTKEIRTDTGKVVVGDNTVFGYYTQSGIQLAEDKRLIDVVRDVAEYIPMEKGQKLTAEQLLERFLFNRKQQQVYVSKLSGGERRRLHLLVVLMRNPNFLILDEPTNDLDIVTLNVLEEFLIDFPGCLIVVTHDRYFMDKIVDHLFVFEGNGVITDFIGDYSEFRAYQKESELEQRRQERSRQDQRRQQEETQSRETGGPRLTYQDRKEMNRLEKEINKLEKRKAEILERFAVADITNEEIEELSIELGTVKKQIEEKEMRWMELAELG